MGTKTKIHSQQYRFSKTTVEEILLAMAIFTLPFKIYIHVLFKKVHPSIFSSNENFTTQWDGDMEVFVWCLSTNLMLSILFAIWFYKEKRPYKLFLLFPLSCFVLSLLVVLFGHIHPFVYSHVLDYYGFLILAILCFLFWRYRFKIGQNEKSAWQKRDYVAALLLFSLISTFYWSRFYPEDAKSVVLFGLDFGDLGFADVRWGIFLLFKKIAVMGCLLVWYLLEVRWWKYALLSPIILTANQLFNIIGSDTIPIDEIELTQSVPFLLVLAIFLIALAQAIERQKKIQTTLGNWYAAAEEKLGFRFKNKEHFINEKRKELQRTKATAELVRIKEELEQELRNS